MSPRCNLQLWLKFEVSLFRKEALIESTIVYYCSGHNCLSSICQISPIVATRLARISRRLRNIFGEPNKASRLARQITPPRPCNANQIKLPRFSSICSGISSQNKIPGISFTEVHTRLRCP